MRIIHVVPFYLPATRYGGPIFAVHGLCKALARQGHDVHVFTTSIDGAGDADVPIGVPVELDGVHVHYYRTTHLRRMMWAPRLCVDLAKELDDNTVLHLNSVFTFPTTAAARLAQVRRVPYIVSPHGALVARYLQAKNQQVKKLWLRLLDEQTLARAAHVHVTSQNEYKELTALGLELPDVINIPHGVEPPVLVDVSASRDDEPYGVFLGRISWVKGLDRALRALRHTRARLLIVGSDDEGLRSELQASARDLGVGDRVEFAGPVDGADKWSLLRRARFLVLPSYSENFGMVVVEAMAMHCPVIVTPEVGAADVLYKAQVGMVVNGRPNELGAAMERFWSLPSDERQRLGRIGAEYVRDRLSWDSIARSFSATYERMLDDGKPRPTISVPSVISVR